MATSAGIDIGSDAVKAVVLSAQKTGPIEVTSAGAIHVGEIGHMEDSPDKNLAIALKIRELVRSARIRAEVRRVGTAGKNTSIKYLQVPPVPPWRLDMLVKYEVEEKASDGPSTFDYRILDVPEVGGQYTVMIGSCREEAAAATMTMAREAGLKQVEIDLEALALYNAYYYGHGFDSDKTVLIADIGADDVTILLCRNGLLYFVRSMLGGGRRFTQVLADDLKIEASEAEEIKKTQGEIRFDLVPAATPGRTGRFQRSGATGIMTRGGSTMMRAPGASASRLATGTPQVIGVPARTPEKPEAAAQPEPPATDPVVLPPESPSPEAGKSAENSTVTDLTLDLPPLMSESASGESEASAESSSAPNPSQAPINLMNAAPAADSNDERRKRQISMALVREAASMCAMLENAVMACKQQTKLKDLKIDRIYVTGGGSQLKGLVEFMSRRMRLEVQPLEPFKQLSLAKLNPAQAEALKGEQQNMAIAVGLALAELQKGAFSFSLWPDALKKRKEYWARGAYLGYAAALAVASLALFAYTPYRNQRALAANYEAGKQAADEAVKQTRNLEQLRAEYQEKHKRLQQISENIQSGEYFGELLSGLKNKDVITEDVWVTQVSTEMPLFVRKEFEKIGGAPKESTPTDPLQSDEGEGASETFQAQRRVYIRGFARSRTRDDVLDKIEKFKQGLVPDRANPNSPRNWLFKEVFTLLNNREQLERGYVMVEFVLEAYLEVPAKEKEKSDAKSAPAASKDAAKEIVAPPVQKAPAPVAQPVAIEKVAPAATAQPQEKTPGKFITPTKGPDQQK